MLKHIVPDLEPHPRQILVGRPDSVPVRLELVDFCLLHGARTRLYLTCNFSRIKASRKAHSIWERARRAVAIKRKH